MEDNKSPTYELAEQDYIAGMKYKDIAEKYGVSINTVKSWKGRYNWSKDKKSVHTKKKKVCTQKKKLESEKEPIAKEVEEVIENGDLTDKQRLFCLYYIKTYNATRSYQRAYNCSYDVANVEGFKNLVKPSIREEILQLKKIRMQTDFMDANDVVRKYQEIAFADEEILDGTEVRTTDKLKALDFLTKYYKLLESESETKEDKLDQYLEQLQGVLKDD